MQLLSDHQLGTINDLDMNTVMLLEYFEEELRKDAATYAIIIGLKSSETLEILREMRSGQNAIPERLYMISD